MANQCENCGKPIRPNANFCGFCGQVIGDPGKAIHLPGGVGASQNGSTDTTRKLNACPHCGKINRPGVAFCANCGKNLSDFGPPLEVRPKAVQLSQPKKSRPRIVTIGLLAGAAVVVCGSLFLAAWGFGWLDRIFLPSKSTGTEAVAVQALTDTQLSSRGPTSTMEDGEVVGTETSTMTATKIPPSPTITRTLPPTTTLPPTRTGTPEIEPAFIEDFNGTLDQWYTWVDRPGENSLNLFPPFIKGNEYLDLVGLGYDKVGVTAIQTTTFTSGVVVEFRAEVVDNILDPSLYFDWYPGLQPRNPWRIGPFFLVIDKDQVVLHYTNIGVSQQCAFISDGAKMKLYRVAFGSDWNLKIYVEDGGVVKEVCSVTIDELPNTIGRITFSGFGFIDSVKFIEP